MAIQEKNDENDCISSITLVYIESDKMRMYRINGSHSPLKGPKWIQS